MKKDPALMLYTKDWLEGTSGMRKDEKGVFIDLLCHQHQKGILPSDIHILARMVGMAGPDEKASDRFVDIWKVLSAKFAQVSGGLQNKKTAEVIAERSEAARKHAFIGAYGKLLREAALTEKQKKIIKSQFRLADFYKGLPDDTERMTKWFYQMVDQMVNQTRDQTGNEDAIEIGNANGDTKENNSITVFKGGMGENETFLPAYNVSQLEEYLTQAVRKQEGIMTAFHLSLVKYEKLKADFITKEKLKESVWVNQKDALSHFINWLVKELKFKPKSITEQWLD